MWMCESVWWWSTCCLQSKNIYLDYRLHPFLFAVRWLGFGVCASYVHLSNGFLFLPVSLLCFSEWMLCHAIALFTKLIHIETELKMYYANPMILCHTHKHKHTLAQQRIAQTKKELLKYKCFHAVYLLLWFDKWFLSFSVVRSRIFLSLVRPFDDNAHFVSGEFGWPICARDDSSNNSFEISFIFLLLWHYTFTSFFAGAVAVVPWDLGQ